MKSFVAKFVSDAPLSVSPVSALSHRVVMLSMTGAMVCQGLLLIVAGLHNRYLLQFDAVCYTRIASYYANGQTDLMVSGYWGPLLSWLIAPFLGLVENQLDATRIAMGLSAVVFLLGCISVFKSLQIPLAGVVLGTWIAAAASVRWSLIMNPDLLMAGLLALAISRMVSPQWLTNVSTPWAAGMLCGVAYLAKSVAFPVTFGLGIGIGALWVMSGAGNSARVLRSLGMTLLGFLLIVGPWVITLSWKYQQLTISTSAKINHTIVGPPDVDREYPLRTFYPPEPGRIAAWEDPSSMPSHMPFNYWSPFENLAYAKHQLLVMSRNYQTILNRLRAFDLLGIGLLTLVCGFLLHKPWRENLRTAPWRWGSVPVACLAGIYLPVYAESPRYYFPTYPFLIAASVGMINWLTQKVRADINVPRLIGFGIIVCSFATPILIELPKALKGLEHSSLYAHELAQKLQAVDMDGPLAGVYGEGGDESLFVAFFMNQPWYGAERNPTLERLKLSQARLVVMQRKSSLIPELDRHPAFRNLDSVLFESEKEALKFPLKAYRITQ